MAIPRISATAFGLLLMSTALPSQQPDLDSFFRDFTAEWVRSNSNLATSSRFFSGEEQDRLERQLTPDTEAYRRSRIQLARRGLTELARFDRSRLAEIPRVSADLMQWQLDTVVREEPYLDYTFPLNQMNGVNVNVVEVLTVRHPLASEKDAVNYLAALGQVPARMEEAIAESRKLAGKNILPPKFILQATIKQMQSFADPAPAQNPFVTVFAQKLDAISSVAPARRAELRAQAEKIVGSE